MKLKNHTDAENLFRSFLRGTQSVHEINCEITEFDEGATVSFEMPGIEKDDIVLHISKTQLEVKAHRTGKRYGRPLYFGFYKRVDLPFVTTPEQAKVSYKNGILEIFLPREHN